MLIFIAFIWFLAFLYAVLIWVYRYWFNRLQVFTPDSNVIPQIFFSIIIPARNEENNIGACLASIAKQQYPAHLMEVIVVDDHSEDNTAQIVLQYQSTLPSLALIYLKDHLKGNSINAYKKKAIEIAIAEAKGNWIVTTDADCTMGSNWLNLLAAYIQQYQPVLVAAPVVFEKKNSLLGNFQLLDFASLQGITAAAVAAGYHSMCNGANLAYAKQAFYDVDQFKGIDQIASGDDMLLMYKMKKKFPGKMGFLFHRDAIVYTAPVNSWRAFFQQRIRWASKADSYADKTIFYVLLIVYLLNASILVTFIMGCWNERVLSQAGLLLLFKTAIELSFMIPVANFFSVSQKLWLFPLLQPIHIIYTVIAGWLGKFGSYEWKQRKVN
ncbi:MAG: glycosyltransferase [Sediminibacterium sp.]|jgi:cellulose synthase/poly-beta-1,6-N-acetylglucosamine synthase-like glycosyltransferase|nr:glycosyltransferase [Chitinophagaceae bacterium]